MTNSNSTLLPLAGAAREATGTRVGDSVQRMARRNPPFGHRNPDSLTKQCNWCGKPAWGQKQGVWLCKGHLRREQNARWPKAPSDQALRLADASQSATKKEKP